MVGSLSQLITLASAVNGTLQGSNIPEDFFPVHPSFKFCNRVSFVVLESDRRRRPEEVEVASDPNAWLGRLLDEGAQRAWLSSIAGGRKDIPDHRSVAFVGGGGQWVLGITYPDHTESWVGRWEVTDREAPDQRIWGVTYGRTGISESPFSIRSENLGELAAELQGELARAYRFATGHQLTGFAEAFRRAFDLLKGTSQIRFPDYVRIVCADGYPPAALRLLGAAYAAWVFGGMGSWNDLSFDSRSDRKEYNSISHRLYRLLNQAVQAGVNAYEGVEPEKRMEIPES